MVNPELRDIVAAIEPPALPADPADCAVPFQLRIGPRDAESAESFSLLVVTPLALARAALDAPVWGRGHLVVPIFDWNLVVRAIAELLARCSRPTWEEVVADLTRELRWDPGSEGGA